MERCVSVGIAVLGRRGAGDASMRPLGAVGPPSHPLPLGGPACVGLWPGGVVIVEGDGSPPVLSGELFGSFLAEVASVACALCGGRASRLRHFPQVVRARTSRFTSPHDARRRVFHRKVSNDPLGEVSKKLCAPDKTLGAWNKGCVVGAFYSALSQSIARQHEGPLACDGAALA